MADEREEALQYAARLRGLSLIRTGNRFALAKYMMTDATLDEIAAFLASDDSDEREPTQGGRRADLRAMLKAEHELLVEMARETSRVGDRSHDHARTQAALAEIRRRIAEIQGEMGQKDAP